MKILRNVTDFDPGSDTPQGAVGAGTLIAAGDLTGSHAAPKVSGIGGATISGTPAAGEAVVATSGSAASWQAVVVNPMTTEGDIIYDHSAAPTRLGIGAAGTILSSNGTDPSWGNGPMTTKGDLIVGGTSGAPARLPVGTDTYVLTADSSQTDGLKWAAGGGGGGGLPVALQPIQDKGSGGGTNTNALAFTLRSTPTNGNLLIACIDRDATGAISNITQTGVTWSQVVSSGNAATPVVEIWKGVVGSGASASGTINCATTTFTGYHISEWHGVTGTLDTSATTSHVGVVAGAGTSTASITPGSANALVIGCVSTDSNTTQFHQLYGVSYYAPQFPGLTSDGSTCGAGYSFPGTNAIKLTAVNGGGGSNMSSCIVSLT